MKVEKRKDRPLKEILHDLELEIIFWINKLSGGRNEIRMSEVMRAMEIDDIRDLLGILKILIEHQVIELIAQKAITPESIEEYYEAVIRLKPTKEVEELIEHAKRKLEASL